MIWLPQALAVTIGDADLAREAVATVGVAAFLSRGNGDADVADRGGVADLELMDGLVVDVVPGPVESEGALVYQGVLGPEPRFDTSSPGTEVPLARRNPSEFVVPTLSNPLESNALQASRLVYLGDINGHLLSSP